MTFIRNLMHHRWPVAVIAGLVATALPAMHATPVDAATDPLDYSHVLRLSPPFVAASQSAPATNDNTLTDQLTVEVCRYGPTGCTHLTTLAPTAILNSQYNANWNSSSSNATKGQVFKFTFRVAGLNVGIGQLQAGDITTLTRTGFFVAGSTVRVTYAIANHPVVRTRSMHDRGSGGPDVGQALHQQFALTDSDALAALYRDVRLQDVLQPATTTTAVAGAARVAHPAFPMGSVVDGVAAPGSYSDSVSQIATLLTGRTPSSPQSVVNALVSSSVLRSLGTLTPGGVLAVIRTVLGVPDRVSSLSILSKATTDDGTSPFDATALLRAIASVDGTPTLVSALQQLADVGYGAPVAIAAANAVGLIPAGTTRDGGIPLVGKAALQVPQFTGTDIVGGLDSQFPPPAGATDTAAGLRQAAGSLVADHCLDYTAPVAAGTVADSLRTKTDVVGASDVIGALTGGCAFPLDKAVGGIHYAYTSAIADPATEAISLAQTVVKGLPNTPATDTLLALGDTLKNVVKVPDDQLTCLSTIGTVAGSAAANNGHAVGLPSALGSLDGNGALSGLFQNPFGPGVGGPLDSLGRCLTKHGLNPPLPLRAVTVRFVNGGVPAANPAVGALGINGDLIVGRAGWTPNLPAAVPGRLGDALSAVKVPSVGAIGSLNVPSLQQATTLPVLVVGGPNKNVAHEGGRPECSSDAFTDGAYVVNWPYGGGVTCSARGNILDTLIPRVGSDQPGVFPIGVGSAVSFSPGTLSPTQNGVATFIVPALPGQINLEGTFFGNNNLTCASNSPQPAVMAAAIAAPAAIYGSLPGGGTDIWATNSTTVDLPVSPNRPDGSRFDTFNFGFNGGNTCTGRTIRTSANILGDDPNDSYLEGDIYTRPVGVADTLDAVNKLVAKYAGKLTVTPNASAAGNNFGIDPLKGGTLAGLGGLLPQDVDANFLSMLAALGGTPLAGPQVQSLLTRGIIG